MSNQSPFSPELQEQINEHFRKGKELKAFTKHMLDTWKWTEPRQYERLTIDHLHINQLVKVYHPEYTEWNDLICRIVGLSIDKNGIENITLDDGSGCHYDGWKLKDIILI